MPEHILLEINSIGRANFPGLSLGGNTYSRNKIPLFQDIFDLLQLFR
jgi:hypothetical protein